MMQRIRERKMTRAKTPLLSDPNKDQSIDGANSNEDEVNNFGNYL